MHADEILSVENLSLNFPTHHGALIEGHAGSTAEYPVHLPGSFHLLNPRPTIGASIEEPMVIHRLGDKAARMKKVRYLFGDGLRAALDPKIK